MLSVLLIPKWLRALVTCIIFCLPNQLLAEDTEIFNSGDTISESNILVVLDNSGSMNELVDGSIDTRMVALSKAFEAFTANPEIKDINIGLMAFSNGSSDPRPHGISVPVSPIDDEIMPIMISNLVPGYLSTGDNFGFFDLTDDNLPDPLSGQTVRTYLPEVIGAWVWKASGGTPIVDALHEASLYFKGMPPKWGGVSAEQDHAAHPSSYTGQYTATLQRTLTGSKRQCDTADCGINCLAIQVHSECSVGDTSCHTGTGCFTHTAPWSYKCDLGSQADCEALDNRFSCSESTKESCTTTCNGETDLESGKCLTTESESCTTETHYSCAYDQVLTSCLKNRFECDATKDTKVNSGTATYISPITKECQSNTIVLMSDGAPNVNGLEDDATITRGQIKTLIGSAVDCAAIDGQVIPNTVTNTLSDGRCGPELVKYLSTVDQSDSVDGDNVIKTYTVGFAVDQRPTAGAYLKSLAVNGGGKYFPANDSAALASAFLSIANDVGETARSFAAPVYTVDPASMLSHSDDIYLPLFKNSDLPAWSGNLKKFKLNNAGEIVDANGAVAFDNLGQLKPDAVDFWMPTGAAIGTDPITSGGFANNVKPASRKLLTDNRNALVSLSSTASKVDLGNASMSDTEKSALINYITGFEADGVKPRNAIGDILHSKPTLISYGGTKQVMFFGTNEGLLHAVDAADATDGGGVEKFAFMPSSLLGNIDAISKNEKMPDGGLSRIYGVDGSISAIIKDNNKNGKVDLADGDTATLIFGMRRGGSEYYALNVTNPDSPTLKWKITASGIFSNLGETWSKPIPTKLRYLKGGTVTLADVLVFGGGYDNRLDEEDKNLRSSLSSGKGNGVYIVDLETGQEIWSYTNGDLKHSVPGNIRTIDIDGDGSVERLYFGDTGGNLWRVDLNAYDNYPGRKLFDVKNNAQLTHFADLGGTGADYRKFFFEPDVSVFKDSGKERLVLSIGSGYRSHPLNAAIEDRFYVLSDENVRSVPPINQAALTDADLMPTSALSGGSFMPSHGGWYKSLNNGSGEKVLASSITFMQKVAFTTFAINDSVTTTVDASGCIVSNPNLARAYVLDLTTGLAVADLDGDGVIDDSDQSILVPGGDILDTPQLYFNKVSNCTNDGCDHIVDIRVGKKTTPLIDEDTAGGGNNLGDFVPKVYWVAE